MGKKRIYELAKEMNQSSKDVVEKAHALGMDVKNHMGAISSEDESKLRNSFGGNKPANTQQKPAAKPQAQSGQGQTKPANQKPANQNGNRPNQNQTRPQQPNGQQNRPQQNNQNRPAQQGQQNNQNRNNQNRNMQGSSQNMTQNRTNQGQQNRPQQNNQNRPAQSGQQNNQNRSNTQNRSTQGNTQNTNQNRPAATQSGQQNRPQQGQNNSNTQGNQNRNNTNTGNRNNSFGGGGGQNRNRNGYNNQNRNRFNKKGKKGKYQESTKPAVPARKFRELPDVLEYTEGMNVADIAKKIHREPAEIIKKLFMMGVMVNQNQSLDKETIELLAVDYGMEPQEKVQVDVADIDKFFEPEALVEENLLTRPPVVTIMGHVDHGKTTLLDTLRNSRVTSGEAGGITQHIGAYQIDIDGKPITFLDTPGHAAFTSMRARGAGITDITILVVAADDGVMPQTVEAINHAKAAEVPIIVAVNKVDKPGANPDHVKQELSEHGLIPEEWGGETIFVNISAKFNQNIDELLENILLIAEVEDLKADPTQRAIGTVIEARLDKGKGPVATLLVQQGSLRVGDPIVVGNTFGRVRVMTNDLGRRDKAVGPATPVEITGLNDVPQAGDRFVVFEDEKTARQAGEERGKRAQLEQRSSTNRVTLDNLFESLKEGELKDVNVIIKADVQGTAEALAASLQKIEVAGVRVKIVHSAVGAINESDVTLAAASNAIIIGFNVRPTPQAKQQSDQEEVDIRLHRIIYKAIEEIETAMKGMLDPEFEEKITGQMTVRELYKVSKVGTIAGCYVTEGSIRRDSGVRVIRDGIVIFEGKLSSLKRFKDDAKEVKLGFECGAMVENFNDLKVDDVIEGFVMEEIKQ
ncbi:translation initiation factor IF-2 [Enterococcus plantarum]|uniref:Translation initiation factor IF-2 n=1 Tax=Enterococcus plantarum TaxID=1077675 RepID=A0A2W3ZF92_9ENTE|nr:translation initiation factor IF-2 [Enterococcus plantarum]PZL75177.1 translation initiation factor IF-2 [Enterococcus plantarum]